MVPFSSLAQFGMGKRLIISSFRIELRKSSSRVNAGIHSDPAGQDAHQALVVRNVSKRYEIYARPRDRVKQLLLPSLQRFFSAREGKAAYYKEFWALKDVSFSLSRGEALGVLGRNGAGKSTLLQIVAGTSAATEGDVLVRGRVAALLELGSGFSPEFTGAENVRLNASLLGLTPTEIDAKFDDICRFADIGQFINQPVRTYSSGMMLRLAFAVQAAVEPEVLIVDEALAVGDARFQKKCYARLDELRASGTTILLVTHDSAAVIQSCDRALILDRGGIIASGEARHIAREYHKFLFGPAQTSQLAPSAPSAQLPNHSTEHARGLVTPQTQTVGASTSQAKTKKEVRYGSGELEIQTIGIRNADGNDAPVVETHAMCVAYFAGIFRQAVSENVDYGFIISSPKGIEIYGTKSPFYADCLKPSEAGTRFECRVEFCMRLVPGRYLLSAALAFQKPVQDSQFIDFRFDALDFEVVGQSRAFETSIVDLDARMSHVLRPRTFADQT